MLKLNFCFAFIVLTVLGIAEMKAFTAETEQYTNPPGQSKKLKLNRQELLRMVRKRVYPSYPPEAVAIKTMPGFSILVAVEVNPEGKVIYARSIAGPSILKNAAVEAAKLWEFAPITDKSYSSASGVINFMLPDERVQWNKEHGLDRYVDEARKNPLSWLAHCRLATAYWLYKQPAKAVEEYQKALALQPSSPEILYGLGETYLAIEQPSRSLQCFQQAVEKKPDFVEAIYAIAGIYRDWGQTAEAIATFQQAIKVRPDDIDVKDIVYTNLYSIYEKLGQAEKAILMLEESVKLSIEKRYFETDEAADNPIYDLKIIADHYEKMERYEDAIRAYQRMVDFEEPVSYRSLLASMNMASLYKKLGKQAEAMAVCQQWLDSVNKSLKKNVNGEADEMRGRIYMEMDRNQEAILFFKKAAAKKPSNSIRPNEYLYDLYLKVGDQKEAAKQKEIINKFYDEYERPMREGKIIRIKP